jgi:hypothetical protein
MTRSKLTAAMAAGFLMGQAFGLCDALPDLLRCGCAESVPARSPDRRATPSHGGRSIRRGGPARRFVPCEAAWANAAVQ